MKSFRGKIPVVAVFLKYPDSGLVKTRMAATVGAKKAAAIYRRMVTTLLENISASPDYDIHLFADPHRARAAYNSVFPTSSYPFHWQKGHDLGTRLAACFDELLAKERRVILIGSDCLDITPSLLKEAGARLQHDDLVLGPATDGGYYLIGLSRQVPELFRAINWGTETVLSETERAAHSQNLVYSKLIPLSDIDTEADLRSSKFQELLLEL